MATQGGVIFKIIGTEDHLEEKLNNAIKQVVDDFIEPTAIDLHSYSLEKHSEDEYLLRFQLLYPAHEYEVKDIYERKSGRFNSDNGRAVFEFFMKLMVNELFDESLKVETKHTQISLAGFKDGYADLTL